MLAYLLRRLLFPVVPVVYRLVGVARAGSLVLRSMPPLLTSLSSWSFLPRGRTDTRSDRARARVRRCSRLARHRAHAPARASSASRCPRLHRRRDHDARAGLHHRRSDPSRTSASAFPSRWRAGDDAAGRVGTSARLADSRGCSAPAAAVLGLNLVLQRSGINPGTISPDEPFRRLRPDFRLLSVTMMRSTSRGCATASRAG